jgi:Zn-dependent protease
LSPLIAPVFFIVLAYSIILHEVMHGFVARLNGDPTAGQMGRLTLNPLPHVDWIGTVILPIALVLFHAPFFLGWAKPVPYNPIYFRRVRLGTFLVAAAGPAVNLVLAAVFAASLRIFKPHEPAATVLFYGLSLNVMLAIFNLLPVPPLDGSKMLAMLLPSGLRRAYLSFGRWGIVLLMLLLYQGALFQVLLPLYKKTLIFFLN